MSLPAARTAWEGLNPPYATIVADPPWPFVWKAGAGGRRARATVLPYSVTTVDEIAAMPVADLAAEDATLAMWATREMFREGHAVRVARAWGFEPYGELIWEKANLGTGAWPRPCHEPVLLARRGRPPVPADRAVRSVHRWKQHYASGKTHTTKPGGLCDLIEAHFPGPYVELFARQPRLGWDHWGHGYEIGASA